MSSFDDFLERDERFSKHLPDTDDMSLLVLKGHLLIEESLNDILIDIGECPEYINKARLSFYQKIQLLRAFHGTDVSGDNTEMPWLALERINSLRNKLSHHIEPKDLNKNIEQFIELFGLADSDSKNRDIKETLIKTRMAICMLSGWVDATRATKSGV